MDLLKLGLMPALTQSEAQEILSSVNTDVPMGKRNYAIMSIAMGLGVRAGDITNLKLNDISWETDVIKFFQQKTGAELVLPLEAAVGNAVAEYILNARPKTDSGYIFIRCFPPYDKLDSLSNIFRKYAPKERFKEGTGLHSFRRLAASQLLNAGVPADTVKGILGHTKIDSLKPYARISDLRLKSCALSLSGIETIREGLK